MRTHGTRSRSPWSRSEATSASMTSFASTAKKETQSAKSTQAHPPNTTGACSAPRPKTSPSRRRPQRNQQQTSPIKHWTRLAHSPTKHWTRLVLSSLTLIKSTRSQRKQALRPVQRSKGSLICGDAQRHWFQRRTKTRMQMQLLLVKALHQRRKKRSQPSVRRSEPSDKLADVAHIALLARAEDW